METVRAKIVGLSWRKIQAQDENDYEGSPVAKLRSRRSTAPSLKDRNRGEADDKVGTVLLKRARSVRDAFGTIKQKLRMSTRRKKRLVNQSPFVDSRQVTPGSVRRSARRSAHPSEVKMYSPFNILESPSISRGTPRQIRMGTHTPRRFNFSSPGGLKKDVKSLEEGIQALSDLGDNFDTCIRHKTEGSVPQRDLAHQQLAQRIAQQQRKIPIFV